MTAEVHQEVHSKFEPKDPHVEDKDPVDALLVGAEVSIGLVDHVDPELAQYPDAGSGAPVHRRLHQRNKEELGDEESERAERHPWVEMNEIGKHREQDAALEQRLGYALADEPADGLDFRDDHRDRDPLRIGGWGGGGRYLDDRVYASAQVADGALADPAPIHVEDELGPALDEHDTGIDRAQDDDPAVGTVLDQVVDDPALQFERDDFYQKDADGQRQEQQLMRSAGRHHIAEDAAG